MSFSLDKVVPWGRTYEEYVAMFALSGEDLKKRILGIGDGPASFNAMLSRQGGHIVSVDPLYQFAAQDINMRIEEARWLVMGQIRANMDEMVWGFIPSPEALEERRMGAMRAFLEDFEDGKREGRYVCGELPSLSFPEGTFDLALCSHFLLHYPEQLDLDFHMDSLRELCRVAGEVRIFPVLELGAKRSRHLEPLMKGLVDEGYEAELVRVDYEFIKGGNEMLRVRSPDCRLG